jgi:aquaporin Z
MAEAAGTGLMVLVIVAAASLTVGRGAGFLALGAIVGPCIGLIVVSPIGRISGAHINPAVTLGFWALGRVSRRDLAGYVAAQLVGGVAGALVARALLPRSATESIGGAVTHPSVPAAGALALEFGMTALLLVVVFAFASSARLMRFTPLAIVPLLAAIIWLGSPGTGASLNPARSGGPAVAFGDLGDLWLYFVAPAAAGLVVGLLWRRLSMPRPRMAGLCPVTPGRTDALLAQTPR